MWKLFVLLSFLIVTCVAQNARMGEGNGKILLAVPMVGAGTWADPKRPAHVREAGVPYRFQVSDDGTMALVEAAPRSLAELRGLEAQTKADTRAKVFRADKDKLSDVISEFKKLKKDFDAEEFGKKSPPVKTKN
jgi:hypothetical protein